MLKFKLPLFFLILTGLVMSLSPVSANMDSGLYDPLPPEGSAFIRFLNASSQAEPIQGIANGQTYKKLGNREISPYYVVPRGEIKAGFSDTDPEEIIVEAALFYTMIRTADGIVHLIDPAHNDRSKAQILFYNLSDTDGLSLKTKDGSVSIVDSTDHYKSGARPINAVKVELSVFDSGGKKVVDMPPLSMDRGMVYTGVVFSDNMSSSIWVKSETDIQN